MASPAIYAPLVMRQPSAADYAGQWQDLEASKTRNALANFGMQQAKEQQAAAAQRQNVLREIANLPPEQQAPAMQRAGLWAEAQGLEKHRADLLKTDAEARSKSAETVAKKAATWRQALDFVRTPDDLRRYSAAVYSDPDMQGTPFTATPIEQWMQAIPDDPAQFADLHRRLSIGMEKYIEATAPKYVNAGGAQVQTNPLATAKDIPITMSEADKAADARARQALAIQQRNAATAEGRLALDKGAATQDSGGPGQAAMVARFGKPPKDYRWKPDGTAEPIPGGPADIKAGEQGAKADARKQAADAQSESVLSAVKSAKGLVGYNTAGVGGLLANIPATDARDLQAHLNTIKANLGFDRLQQMREMSPTGGALGQVAVQELQALQATVASLDQLQSVPQLKSALDKIERHYTRWQETLGSGSGGASGSPKAPRVLRFDAQGNPIP